MFKDGPELNGQHISDIYKPDDRIDNPDEESTDLDDLVGLVRLKKHFKEFINLAKYEKGLSEYMSMSQDDGGDELLKLHNSLSGGANDMQKAKDTGLGSFHMVFKGNPGTGKTTVAHRVHNILKQAKIIVTNDSPKFLTRADLVGMFLGETEKKVLEIIGEAKHGILFIDEAYTLGKKEGAGEGNQSTALDIIMEKMELYRDELVVIMAGYKDEMDDLLQDANTGLKSRIKYIFEFDDYTDEEMLEILERFVKRNGLILEPPVGKAAKAKMGELNKKFGPRSFGNARGVRNFYEYMKNALTNRIFKELDEPIDFRNPSSRTFTEEDVKAAHKAFEELGGSAPDEKTMGFKSNSKE